MKIIIIAMALLAMIGFSSIFSNSKAVTNPNYCYHVADGTVDPIAYAVTPPHSSSCPPIPSWVHGPTLDDKDYPVNKDHPEDHHCATIIVSNPQQ